MCTVLLPPGGYPTAVNKYIMYRILNRKFRRQNTIIDVVKNLHYSFVFFNPLNAELNLIFHLMALLGAHHILHVSRVRFKCKSLL